MVDENLSRYLWKGLDLKRYSVAKIIPQDDTNAVIIMFSNDPNDPHWCLEYMGVVITLILPSSSWTTITVGSANLWARSPNPP